MNAAVITSSYSNMKLCKNRKNTIHFFVFYCVFILLSGCGVKANLEESSMSLDHLFFCNWIIKEDFKWGTVSI